MISYVLPTRNRHGCLARTLLAIGSLPAHEAEVLVVDNASDRRAVAAPMLANGVGCRVIRRPSNEGAAARNVGVMESSAASGWVVMLDDDSHPVDLGFLDALREQPGDVAAVCAEIFLPACGMAERFDVRGAGAWARGWAREAGGLPEVPIGCGVAYRRDAFLGAGIHGTAGYDPWFGYYAEEYDLAARLMLAWGRIVLDRRFAVMHEKTGAGRSMDKILRRLVRNNAWVTRRYSPHGERGVEARRTMARYARIAWKERAVVGYLAGVGETLCTLGRQPRMEMGNSLWDRFTAKSACRGGLQSAWKVRRFASAAIVAPGKNEHVVRGVLQEMGIGIAARAEDAEALVIGTLSPGPALDAYEQLATDARVIEPWPVHVGRDEAIAPRVAA